MNRVKILIAHPGKQHSFQMAEAIASNPIYDVTYITTIYDKNKSWLMRLIKLISSPKNKERANSRKSEVLTENQVITFYSFYGLIRIFLAHYDKSQKYFHKMTCFLADKFGKKVAKYAINNNFDIVVTYDTFSEACYKYIDKYSNKIIKVMDASAANLAYQKEIFEKDLKENPDYAKKLLSEVGFTMNSKRQKYYVDETKRADYIISASNFSKESYRRFGVPEENIFVCPYGIDTSKFFFKSKIEKKEDIVKFVFLGRN